MNASVYVAITCFLLVTLMTLTSGSGQLMSKEHRTHAASERANDLSCYRCFTMNQGEKCINITQFNATEVQEYEHKCTDDRRICMVKRFSYTTSTENSTSAPRTWSLERNCTNKCEAGCIVIGERTKLYACTSCCEANLCNVGNGISNDLIIKEIDLLLALVLQAVLTVIIYPS
ncbi:PREDICTED: uncharacterized protein LOC105451602 isoform X2 [Wasmannia auropunctata]|uniref:uncharacterized protein LOC105451602 isoform X2 n=1 Tax=Wasmannia auropunctata TaxID=64793 RepID=UPI0005EFB5AF|nr:PREDICTED: uncharacterized protein LOC105451602 isoform X2 [Wasmannia auropunctata]